MARLLHALLLMALSAACADMQGNPAMAVAGADPAPALPLPSQAPAMQPPPLVKYKFGSGYAPYFRQAGVYSKYSGNGTTVATTKGGPIQLVSA